MVAPKRDPGQEQPQRDKSADPWDAVARASQRAWGVVTNEDARPIAVVVPLADLDRLEADDQRRAQAIAGLERIGQHFADCDPDEVERVAIKAIAESRAERRAAAKA